MKNRSKLFAALVLGATLPLLQPAGAGEVFKFNDHSGQSLDVLCGDRLVGRYMYAYDKSTPEKTVETYKPYLHVFDAVGQAPLTKGPGGLYTHHRALFIGWNKIGFAGKTYDRWHMKGGEQVHQKFLTQEADADHATFTSLVNWNGEADKPILQEERTMTFRRAPAPAYLLVDFTSKLTAPNGDILLDGDPEHSGVQFRPADEVDRSQTVYLFPKENANPTTDLDYPWVAETFALAGKHYSVMDLSHPANPKGARWSAYRDYGRFGAFSKQPIKSGETLVLKYRLVIAEGDLPPSEFIQSRYNEFAGGTDPVPKTTATQAAAKGASKKEAKPAKAAGSKKAK